MADKIVRCPIVLEGGPLAHHTMHVPPDSDRDITVVGRSMSEFAGVRYVKAPMLTYRLQEDPDPDRVIVAKFVSIRPSSAEPAS